MVATLKANSNSKAASSLLLAHCGSHQGDRCLVGGPENFRMSDDGSGKQASQGELLKGREEVMRQSKYQWQTLDSPESIGLDLQKRFLKTFHQTAQSLMKVND